MRRVLVLLALSILVSACSSDPPSVRVRNERSGTEKANVQLHPGSGSTINFNDVQPGQTTGYTEVPENTYRVQASISGVTSPQDATLTAEKDKNYTVVVLAGNPPALRIDVEDKGGGLY
jgi:hypothetical protein